MTKISIRVTKLLTFALLLLQNVRCESYIDERSLSTSVVGMKFLLETERQLLSAMEKYANKLENKLTVIRGAMTEMRTENLKSQINPEEYLSNPINSYALIRRLHEDWAKWELYFRSKIGTDEINAIKKLCSDVPTSVDLMEASEAIYRINSIYDISPADMAAGLMNGKQYNARLSAIDCFSIGYHMFQNNKNYLSELWLNTSLRLYQNSDINAILKFDKMKILELYGKVLPKQGSNNKTNNTSLLEHNCNQRIYQSKLYCLYNKTTTAFLQLAPLKMEILHLDPYIVLYHDVISDAESAALKNEAENKLQRAKTFTYSTRAINFTKTRTVKVYWLQNFTNISKRLDQRITDMSGFDLWDSEKIQIMNYGMGGHYSTHYDYLTEALPSKAGDRMATVLFYLSDVEQGGAIVFPKIKISVLPKKGNALLWYNLNIKGHVDPRTLHTACPVIVGSKWVLSKWIREHSQMFRRRCYA